MSTTRTPTLYLSHGAPPLADDDRWTRELADWSGGLARPRAILVVSAHWEDAPLTVGATADDVPLTYDFWGFPQRYYEVVYPAPGAPWLAERVRELATGPGGSVRQDPARGLDHGAYVPLKEMYPEADIPVLQVSMPTLDPGTLLALGRRLAPLRDEGVLIVGSGFTTHNLREMSRRPHGEPPSWSAEFDDWVHRSVSAHDVDALLDFRHKAPASALAHPRSDHFAPLFVALGAGLDGHERSTSTVDGFWHGLAKRSFQFE
ncbi:dioxygenase [Nocardiopsis sp. EMB25]|uniref:dioxygenase family protein n=1 Tax=Nocardiopsis sp. EMB25 TaxID=2835867 RepID=UPI0022848BCA|nr:class III extradiol ring-cleavage dioxygenase [Nocardiopsis sp. EMB25]MCY9787019.1 dioxygenase [Nocardiopsis sp. EMB25]